MPQENDTHSEFYGFYVNKYSWPYSPLKVTLSPFFEIVSGKLNYIFGKKEKMEVGEIRKNWKTLEFFLNFFTIQWQK